MISKTDSSIMADTTLEDHISVRQAREAFEREKIIGCICPVCKRPAKVYRRKITSAMAYGLILLHRRGEPGWIHICDFFKELDGVSSSIQGDIPKLRFWGFLERKEGEREDENPNNGYYAVTQAGRDFINGLTTAPKYAFMWDDTVLKFSDETTDIRAALTDRFNYAELMRE